MSERKMPQPPVGWKPKAPISTVVKPVSANDASSGNLSQNIQRLESLENRGFIQDWDWKDGSGHGLVYFVTLLNGDEIRLKSGHIPVFYLASMNIMCFYEEKTFLMPKRELAMFLNDEED